MDEELIPCPICSETEFNISQMEDGETEGCLNCGCEWNKMDLLRLHHNARVAEAAEVLVDALDEDDDTEIGCAHALIRMEVCAARDCRGKERE